MNLIEQLLRQFAEKSGQNKPLLPGQPAGGTPPFVPPMRKPVPPMQNAGTPTPPPQQAPTSSGWTGNFAGEKRPLPPLEEVKPNVTGKHLQDIKPQGVMHLRDIETPDQGAPKAMPKTPFHKDNDRMAMMFSALSDGFGGMTMSGKSGMAAMNKANYAKGMEGVKNNKSMNYLIQHNPELAQKLLKIAPKDREQFMKMSMQSDFDIKELAAKNALDPDGDDPAKVATFKYFQGLDPEEQDQFMRLQRDGKLVKGPDGSVGYYGPNRDWVTLISSADAVQQTAASKAAETGAVSLQDGFDQAASAAKNAANYLPQLREELAMSNQPRAEGFFAPLEGFANAFAEEMGMSPDQATRDQLLKSGATKRVMEWFKNSGLGARGMDTPAEFERFLQAMGGSEKMTNEAYAKLLQRYIAEEERKITDYNAMLTDDRYQDVYNRGNATRYDIPSNQQSNLPPGFVED